MLLAGDVGGTKTALGLFRPGAERPVLVETRSYRTLDYADLGDIARRFLDDVSADPATIAAVSFGVAGPVAGTRARLTNAPLAVDLDNVRRHVPASHACLLNDLEALAWSVSVLAPDELAVLREGRPDPSGNAALIAAGTGLGMALLPRVGGRLVPSASEGGHADFAPRNEEERALAVALAAERGRAEVESVVSGPGIAAIYRHLYPHTCEAVAAAAGRDELPASISRGAIEEGCAECRRTIACFVSAYGAAAGNLALTALATGGMYVGGGIAPRLLPALRWPEFTQSFLDKAPMGDLVSRIPVKVILNPSAALLGAAVYAGLSE